MPNYDEYDDYGNPVTEDEGRQLLEMDPAERALYGLQRGIPTQEQNDVVYGSGPIQPEPMVQYGASPYEQNLPKMLEPQPQPPGDVGFAPSLRPRYEAEEPPEPRRGMYAEAVRRSVPNEVAPAPRAAGAPPAGFAGAPGPAGMPPGFQDQQTVQPPGDGFYQQLRRNPETGRLEGVGPVSYPQRQQILRQQAIQGQLSSASDQYIQMVASLNQEIAQTALTQSEQQHLMQLQNDKGRLIQDREMGIITDAQAGLAMSRIDPLIQRYNLRNGRMQALQQQQQKIGRMQLSAEQRAMQIQDVQTWREHAASMTYEHDAGGGNKLVIAVGPDGKSHSYMVKPEAKGREMNMEPPFAYAKHRVEAEAQATSIVNKQGIKRWIPGKDSLGKETDRLVENPEYRNAIEDTAAQLMLQRERTHAEMIRRQQGGAPGPQAPAPQGRPAAPPQAQEPGQFGGPATVPDALKANNEQVAKLNAMAKQFAYSNQLRQASEAKKLADIMAKYPNAAAAPKEVQDEARRLRAAVQGGS